MSPAECWLRWLLDCWQTAITLERRITCQDLLSGLLLSKNNKTASFLTLKLCQKTERLKMTLLIAGVPQIHFYGYLTHNSQTISAWLCSNNEPLATVMMFIVCLFSFWPYYLFFPFELRCLSHSHVSSHIKCYKAALIDHGDRVHRASSSDPPQAVKQTRWL